MEPRRCIACADGVLVRRRVPRFPRLAARVERAILPMAVTGIVIALLFVAWAAMPPVSVHRGPTIHGHGVGFAASGSVMVLLAGLVLFVVGFPLALLSWYLLGRMPALVCDSCGAVAAMPGRSRTKRPPMTTSPPTQRIAIIGAGVSGLSAAAALREAGHEVRVFDKSRGVGGRTSLRRAEPYTFDHGAQYFTARDADFRGFVDACIADGVAAPWRGRIAVIDAPGDARPSEDDATERFVGVPGMNAIAKHMARGFRIALRARVRSIVRAGETWSLAFEDGATEPGFDVVLVTAPPAQAAPLVAASAELVSIATSVDMAPCWAGMVAFDAPFEASFDGAFINAGPLSWACRDSSKPGRPDGDAWVLHATPEWTRAHIEASPDDVNARLLSAFCEAAGVVPPRIAHADAHLWMFSGARPPRVDGAAFDAELGLGLAGDWLAGAKVQGAWLSGRALAERVLVGRG